MQTPILIAGPTASGKSALALGLARTLGGAIINCDSMQVYEGLRVLTARPSAEEEAQVPHLLYGVLPPSTRCSAGRYGQLAMEALATCAEEGWRPIFVGGTGLYFRALTEGLSAIPKVPDSVRETADAQIAQGGIESLFADLQRRDPETAAGLRASDPQRIQRAWEVLEATGRGLSDWQAEPKHPVIQGNWQGLVLEPDRSWLYARCDQRFETMLATGGVAEAAGLMALNLNPGLPAMKALGVRELGAMAAGDLTRAEAVAQAQMLTRRYAKRQLTWMRNQMGDWPRLDPAASDLVDQAITLIRP